MIVPIFLDLDIIGIIAADSADGTNSDNSENFLSLGTDSITLGSFSLSQA